MPDPQHVWQPILTCTCSLLFGLSLWQSLRGKRPLSLLFSAIATQFGIIILAIHCTSRNSWRPLEDNFDALLLLALSLAIFTVYLQWRRLVAGIEWFVMPVVILLLLAAAFFGTFLPQTYTRNVWMGIHLFSVFMSPLLFTIAAAVGAMYLIVNRRLRQKRAPGVLEFGSLERLERFNYVCNSIGFGLLTIGLFTGLAALRADHKLSDSWYTSPKIIVALIAYLVYAIILHSPINPRMRGRRTAVLSLVGFGLIMSVLVLVQRSVTAS